MKLDRNIPNGHGNKYGLIKMRRLAEIQQFKEGYAADANPLAVNDAIELLVRAGVIDWANTPETECFVIRLKDMYAADALNAYADAAKYARHRDLEYSAEVRALAERSGPNHPNCKKPD